MRNIDKSIFKKKDISLHLKDMFVHNDKIFMELEYKNIIYVMSKKLKWVLWCLLWEIKRDTLIYSFRPDTLILPKIDNVINFENIK